jgi:hypothetical protein
MSIQEAASIRLPDISEVALRHHHVGVSDDGLEALRNLTAVLDSHGVGEFIGSMLDVINTSPEQEAAEDTIGTEPEYDPEVESSEEVDTVAILEKQAKQSLRVMVHEGKTKAQIKEAAQGWANTIIAEQKRVARPFVQANLGNAALQATAAAATEPDLSLAKPEKQSGTKKKTDPESVPEPETPVVEVFSITDVEPLVETTETAEPEQPAASTQPQAQETTQAPAAQPEIVPPKIEPLTGEIQILRPLKEFEIKISYHGSERAKASLERLYGFVDEIRSSMTINLEKTRNNRKLSPQARKLKMDKIQENYWDIEIFKEALDEPYRVHSFLDKLESEGVLSRNFTLIKLARHYGQKYFDTLYSDRQIDELSAMMAFWVLDPSSCDLRFTNAELRKAKLKRENS